MDAKVEINRLTKDELEYELKVHGVTETTDVQTMRSTLRQVLKLSKSSSSYVLPKYPFTFKDDTDAIKIKLQEINTSLSTFAGSRESPDFKKLNTRLAFVFSRINRSQASTAEEAQAKSALLVKVIEASAALTAKVKLANRTSTLLEPSTMDLTTGSVDNPVTSSDSSSEEELVTSSPAALRGATASSSPKPVPVASWGIKFSGIPSEMSVSAFAERVAELKLARNSNDSLLFKSAVDLFSGNALLWYRANRNCFSNWKELIEGLRAEFQVADYNEKLMEEIKKRTQGPNETIGVYVAVIRSLFSRLSVQVAESAQLKIILKNLLPYYQTQLGLTEITSISELIKFGRLLEAKKASMEAYVPPPSRLRSLEPDLAYVRSESVDTASGGKSSCQSISSSKDVQKDKKSARKKQSNTLTCWNCGQAGHRSALCPSPRKKHCFRCGKPNVTIATCSRCSGNGNRAF